MKILLFVFFLLLTGHTTGFSQKRRINDSLSVTFHFKEREILDSNQLSLSIEYRNKSSLPIDIYQYLDEGDKGDRFYNLSIEMQKLKGKKYSPHAMRFYQNAFLYRMEDSLRHYDLPKMKLPAYTSHTLRFNLLKSAKGFLPGSYRFKIHLRVATIRDETEYNDKNFETPPPMDKLEYVSSGWFYFTVKKEIAINFKREID